MNFWQTSTPAADSSMHIPIEVQSPIAIDIEHAPPVVPAAEKKTKSQSDMQKLVVNMTTSFKRTLSKLSPIRTPETPPFETLREEDIPIPPSHDPDSKTKKNKRLRKP